MMGRLVRDALLLAEAAHGRVTPGSLARMVLGNDAYAVLALWRAREAARRLRLPLVGSILRRVQTAIYGVEIDKRAFLEDGVWFVHPVGTVVGGDTRIGRRTKLMGSNTLGTNRDDGYPVIGDDVTLGVGARILGPVHVGNGARVGAGAVVLDDVPPGAWAMGMPARIVKRKDGAGASGATDASSPVLELL
jgi:serine O-acetyltransferase